MSIAPIHQSWEAVSFVRFIHFLKKAILRCKKEFHVNYYNPEEEGFMVMSFSTTWEKARKVRKTLNGFVYIHKHNQYPLACWLENLDEDVIEIKPPKHYTPIVPVYSSKKGNENQYAPQNQHDDNREDNKEHYEPAPKNAHYSGSPVQTRSRSRSRGPDHSSDLNALETELVRQQRIKMEEETKLFALEKKKLEYLKQLGPNDYEKFKKFEEVYRRDDPREISEFLESGQSTGQPEPVPAPEKQKLPCYVGCCRTVVCQMRDLIDSHKDIDSSNRPLLYNLLTTALKKRFTIAMEDKPRLLKSRFYLEVYREKHPFHTDVQLVDELVNKIKTSRWPSNPPSNETLDVAVKCDESPSTGGQNQAVTKVTEVAIRSPEEAMLRRQIKKLFKIAKRSGLPDDWAAYTEAKTQLIPFFDKAHDKSATKSGDDQNATKEGEITEKNVETLEDVESNLIDDIPDDDLEDF
ncbi:uncharacterized protein LOC112046093 isoform X2 [Bicyclus anynana]|uniref:Uncharacterized protein LOC112046093 isoform X2 n=1 Tax=Bicyclus anynana TaxID=110368 RepID=A0A6J1MZL8_BICAN|nr:uncharacterized protein LOC112046093 isoform X2 [Bicyclus anynana]